MPRQEFTAVCVGEVVAIPGAADMPVTVPVLDDLELMAYDDLDRANTG